jgi:NAD(P)H-hydrate repair Nnr-like enzyme with NAD(P)H-hydrate epimerase domain
MKVSTVSETRALDMCAIEEFGIAEELLMKNAGQESYFLLLREFGIKEKTFTIFYACERSPIQLPELTTKVIGKPNFRGR